MKGITFFLSIYLTFQWAPLGAFAQATPPPPSSGDAIDDKNEEMESALEDVQTLDLDSPAIPEINGEIVNDGQVGNSEPDTAVSDIMKLLKPYDYKASGRRDPFRKWTEKPVQRISVEKKKRIGLTALEKWDLSELELLGIVWGVSKPKAMIKDPSGKVHIVGQDTKVGFNEGYIAVIREGEIVVVEPLDTEGNVGYQTRVMKIKR